MNLVLPRHLALAAAVLPALFLSVAPPASAAPAAPADLPPPLQALRQQGVTIVAPFQSASGLRAWAALADGRPAALYLAPDGRHVIAGTALGPDGRGADDAAVAAVLRQPLGDALWKSLEGAHWIADGSPRAPRVVYVFTDPNCPYCNKLWADARPWVDSGRLQLRHVIVGTLTPTSPAKAAALLGAADPAKAFAAYEAAHARATRQALASGHPHPLDDAGLAPVRSVPPAIAAQLADNERLMGSAGLQGTPGVVWRDAKGGVQARSGASDDLLAEAFGPR